MSRLDHENHNYDCGDNISAIVDDCKDLPEAEEEGGDTDEDDAKVEEHDELAKMMVMMLTMMMMTKKYEFLSVFLQSLKQFYPQYDSPSPLLIMLNKLRRFASGGFSKELDSPVSNNCTSQLCCLGNPVGPENQVNFCDDDDKEV